MAFDPLAFLKPSKASTFEGLLSRDMFEKFASDGEEAQSQTAFGSTKGSDRLRFLPSYATEKIDEIVEWLNIWECIEITMGQAILIINGTSQADWENLYVRHLDDQILAPKEIIRTMDQIRKKLLNKIQGITITDIKNTTDTGTIMYSIYIRSN